MRDLLRKIMLIGAFVLNLTAIALAAPQDEFNQLMAEIQKSTNDYSLREKIIKLVQVMEPKPLIPQEAKKVFEEILRLSPGDRQVKFLLERMKY